MVDLPESVRPLFVAAGWQPGRRVEVSPAVPRDHPAAEILSEFGGLTVAPPENAHGMPAPEDLEGHSLARLVKDPQAAWPHPGYTVCTIAGTRGQSVRTERWRYSEWDGGEAGAVLFDEQADPHENLAHDPVHKQVVADMKALLANLPKRQ